jgi:hypothetical protein
VPSPVLTPAPTPSELDLTDYIDESGVVSEALELTFAAQAARIEIPQGTRALSAEDTPLASIQVQPVQETPVPPPDYHIIGLAFNLGPDGATFDPPLSLTLEYDPASCPEGVAEEDLVIAYYNVETGEWVELECTVDPTTHTITAQVRHFTLFAIMGKAGPPAAVSWQLILTTIAGVMAMVGLGLGVFFVVRRRRQAVAG